MRVHDDAVFSVHRAVVQPEAPLRFAFPMHEAALRVGGADLHILTDGCVFWRLFYAGQRLFLRAVSCRPPRQHSTRQNPFRALFVHGFTRVYIGFQVRAAGVEPPTVCHAAAQSLFHDMVKNCLKDIAVVKATDTVLAEVEA